GGRTARCDRSGQAPVRERGGGRPARLLADRDHPRGGADRLAEAQVQTLAEKVQQFEMDTGSLPATLEQLVVEPGGAVGWRGPCARPYELRDQWNTPFEYRVPGAGRPFDIVSYGANRKPGGTSVDADIRNE